jgi:hypothetical protein
MKHFKLTMIAFALLMVVLSAMSAFAQTKKTYQSIEVETFTLAEKVEFEPAQLENLMSGIIFSLKKTNKFQNVTLLNQKSENTEKSDKTSTEPTLKIVGEVTKYSKGSRAARYFIGFGAGATKIKAKVKFIDSASGTVLLEKEVDGTVWIGVFGGSSDGAKSGVAKDIASIAKKNFADNSKK